MVAHAEIGRAHKGFLGDCGSSLETSRAIGHVETGTVGPDAEPPNAGPSYALREYRIAAPPDMGGQRNWRRTKKRSTVASARSRGRFPAIMAADLWRLGLDLWRAPQLRDVRDEPLVGP